MDCPAEERLLRSRLARMEGILHLDFNLAERRLTVYHRAPDAKIAEAIHSLELNAQLLRTEETEEDLPQAENAHQRKLLWTVLGINLSFFVLEIVFGILSKSMGLVADSLDMMADALVYAISLLAVGKGLVRQKRVAKMAGYFQIVLAVLGFAEVLRRFFSAVRLPDANTMIAVSVLALLGNALCLYLLQQSQSREQAHMKASLIFTSNDVVINLGVIVAGLLVMALNSNWPDLIIGAIVFLLVIQGARRILKLAK